MPYTRSTFSTTDPSDSDAAASLGQFIRDLRIDIKERLETLVEDIDAEPLELVASTGTYILYGPEIFMPADPDADDSDYGNAGGHGEVDYDGLAMNENQHVGSLHALPVGKTIVAIHVLLRNDSGSSQSIVAKSAYRTFSTTPTALVNIKASDTYSIGGSLFGTLNLSPSSPLEITNVMIPYITLNPVNSKVFEVIGVRVQIGTV